MQKSPSLYSGLAAFNMFNGLAYTGSHWSAFCKQDLHWIHCCILADEVSHKSVHIFSSEQRRTYMHSPVTPKTVWLVSSVVACLLHRMDVSK